MQAENSCVGNGWLSLSNYNSLPRLSVARWSPPRLSLDKASSYLESRSGFLEQKKEGAGTAAAGVSKLMIAKRLELHESREVSHESRAVTLPDKLKATGDAGRIDPNERHFVTAHLPTDLTGRTVSSGLKSGRIQAKQWVEKVGPPRYFVPLTWKGPMTSPPNLPLTGPLSSTPGTRNIRSLLRTLRLSIRHFAGKFSHPCKILGTFPLQFP